MHFRFNRLIDWTNDPKLAKKKHVIYFFSSSFMLDSHKWMDGILVILHYHDEGILVSSQFLTGQTNDQRLIGLYL